MGHSGFDPGRARHSVGHVVNETKFIRPCHHYRPAAGHAAGCELHPLPPAVLSGPGSAPHRGGQQQGEPGADVHLVDGLVLTGHWWIGRRCVAGKGLCVAVRSWREGPTPSNGRSCLRARDLVHPLARCLPASLQMGTECTVRCCRPSTLSPAGQRQGCQMPGMWRTRCGTAYVGQVGRSAI